MNWSEHISSDPETMFGKIVIKGTRIPVELILEKLAVGYTFEKLKRSVSTHNKCRCPVLFIVCCR